MARGSNNYTWSSAQNVQLTLIYPQNENGNRNETISFVQALIQQVSCNFFEEKQKQRYNHVISFISYFIFQSSSAGRGSIR